MNLIISSQLDQAQKRVIYELTLKKRQSKKSTMSDKQVAARQQLARELMLERKVPPMIDSYINSDSEKALRRLKKDTNGSLSYWNYDHRKEQEEIDQTSAMGLSLALAAAAAELRSLDSDDQTANTTTITSTNSTISSTNPTCLALTTGVATHETIPAVSSPSVTALILHQNPHLNLRQHHPLSSTGSSCSFTRSNSSYSGSSQDSSAGSSAEGQLMLQFCSEEQQTNKVDSKEQNELENRKKEANIKCNKIRLEQLNCELETRLHQYENLVAQEKALLGTYNMVLFTNEGVNNFEIY